MEKHVLAHPVFKSSLSLQVASSGEPHVAGFAPPVLSTRTTCRKKVAGSSRAKFRTPAHPNRTLLPPLFKKNECKKIVWEVQPFKRERKRVQDQDVRKKKINHQEVGHAKRFRSCSTTKADAVSQEGKAKQEEKETNEVDVREKPFPFLRSSRHIHPHAPCQRNFHLEIL